MLSAVSPCTGSHYVMTWLTESSAPCTLALVPCVSQVCPMPGLFIIFSSISKVVWPI